VIVERAFQGFVRGARDIELELGEIADALAAAGVEMGQWTPLAGGVMKWIPQGEAQP